MKFIDPLTTMQYLGGSLPVHIAMAIYCIDEYTSNRQYFSECRSRLSTKLAFDDILIMLCAHLLGILYEIFKFLTIH